MKVNKRLARLFVALASGWSWVAFMFCWFGVAVLMSYDSNFRMLPEWTFNWVSGLMFAMMGMSFLSLVLSCVRYFMQYRFGKSWAVIFGFALLGFALIVLETYIDRQFCRKRIVKRLVERQIQEYNRNFYRGLGGSHE